MANYLEPIRVARHRDVCDCDNPVWWVVWDETRKKVIGHFEDSSDALAVCRIAKDAARYGYQLG